MGKSSADIAFYAYIIPFLISTAAGAIMSGVLLYALTGMGALAQFKLWVDKKFIQGEKYVKRNTCKC